MQAPLSGAQLSSISTRKALTHGRRVPGKTLTLAVGRFGFGGAARRVGFGGGVAGGAVREGRRRQGPRARSFRAPPARCRLRRQLTGQMCRCLASIPNLMRSGIPSDHRQSCPHSRAQTPAANPGMSRADPSLAASFFRAAISASSAPWRPVPGQAATGVPSAPRIDRRSTLSTRAESRAAWASARPAPSPVPRPQPRTPA